MKKRSDEQEGKDYEWKGGDEDWVSHRSTIRPDGIFKKETIGDVSELFGWKERDAGTGTVLDWVSRVSMVSCKRTSKKVCSRFFYFHLTPTSPFSHHPLPPHLFFLQSTRMEEIGIELAKQDPTFSAVVSEKSKLHASLPQQDEELYAKWKRLEGHEEFLDLQEVSSMFPCSVCLAFIRRWKRGLVALCLLEIEGDLVEPGRFVLPLDSDICFFFSVSLYLFILLS